MPCQHSIDINDYFLMSVFEAYLMDHMITPQLSSVEVGLTLTLINVLGSVGYNPP